MIEKIRRIDDKIHKYKAMAVMFWEEGEHQKSDKYKNAAQECERQLAALERRVARPGVWR